MNISQIKEAQEALDRIRKSKDELGGVDNVLNEYRKLLDKSSPFGNQIAEMQRVASELSKLNQALISVGRINNSVYDVVKKLTETKHSHLTNSLNSAFSHINKIAFKHLKAVDETINLNLHNNFFNQNVTSTILVSSLRFKELEALQNNTISTLPSEQFLALFSDFQQSINPQFLEQINLIRDSFAGNLAIAFRDVIESSEDQQEALEKVEAIIGEKFEESSDSSFTTQNTLALIISLLSLIVAIYFNTHNALTYKKSAELHQIRFEQLLKVIEKSTENVNSKNENTEIYYVVEREFDVRANPTFKSMKIGKLFPNTKVKLISRKHKWIYIEWTDYLELIPRYGWVSKKYLKRLNSKSHFDKKEGRDNSTKQKDKVSQTNSLDEEINNLGIEVFGDLEKFKLWLNTPNISLGNTTPLELLKKSYGKEIVVGELTRINYGILV